MHKYQVSYTRIVVEKVRCNVIANNKDQAEDLAIESQNPNEDILEQHFKECYDFETTEV